MEEIAGNGFLSCKDAQERERVGDNSPEMKTAPEVVAGVVAGDRRKMV